MVRPLHEPADRQEVARASGSSRRAASSPPQPLTEIDPLVVGHMLYNQGRMPHFLAKESDSSRCRSLGAVLRATRQIPVERSSTGANRSLQLARGRARSRRGDHHLPRGHADPGPGAVADEGAHRCRAAGPADRRAGGAHRPLGRPGGLPALRQELQDFPAQERPAWWSGIPWTSAPSRAARWTRPRWRRPPRSSWTPSPACWRHDCAAKNRRRPLGPGRAQPVHARPLRRAGPSPTPAAPPRAARTARNMGTGTRNGDVERARRAPTVAVLGAGSWGTTFAKVLADAAAGGGRRDPACGARRAEAVVDQINDAAHATRST